MKITKEEFEKQKKELILEIEEKAPSKYKAERKNIYNELGELFKNCYPKDYKQHYPVLLSIIKDGYFLLEINDPIIAQMSKKLWKFQKHINKIVEKKHNQFTEEYPDWFNDNIQLVDQLTHPLLTPPLKHRPTKPQTDIILSLGKEYLKDCFPKKTPRAKKIAQIFLYFYGMKTYPEDPKGKIDPENIRKLI